MVTDVLGLLKMEVGDASEDVLLATRASWLRHEQYSFIQKARLKRQYLYLINLVHFSFPIIWENGRWNNIGQAPFWAKEEFI